ncbi:unnamed protein product, partial [Scytosiphon promiscuus]
RTQPWHRTYVSPPLGSPARSTPTPFCCPSSRLLREMAPVARWIPEPLGRANLPLWRETHLTTPPRAPRASSLVACFSSSAAPNTPLEQPATFKEGGQHSCKASASWASRAR